MSGNGVSQGTSVEDFGNLVEDDVYNAIVGDLDLPLDRSRLQTVLVAAGSVVVALDILPAAEDDANNPQYPTPAQVLAAMQADNFASLRGQPVTTNLNTASFSTKEARWCSGEQEWSDEACSGDDDDDDKEWYEPQAKAGFIALVAGGAVLLLACCVALFCFARKGREKPEHNEGTAADFMFDEERGNAQGYRDEPVQAPRHRGDIAEPVHIRRDTHSQIEMTERRRGSALPGDLADAAVAHSSNGISDNNSAGRVAKPPSGNPPVESPGKKHKKAKKAKKEKSPRNSNQTDGGGVPTEVNVHHAIDVRSAAGAPEERREQVGVEEVDFDMEDPHDMAPPPNFLPNALPPPPPISQRAGQPTLAALPPPPSNPHHSFAPGHGVEEADFAFDEPHASPAFASFTEPFTEPFTAPLRSAPTLQTDASDDPAALADMTFVQHTPHTQKRMLAALSVEDDDSGAAGVEEADFDMEEHLHPLGGGGLPVLADTTDFAAGGGIVNFHGGAEELTPEELAEKAEKKAARKAAKEAKRAERKAKKAAKKAKKKREAEEGGSPVDLSVAAASDAAAAAGATAGGAASAGGAPARVFERRDSDHVPGLTTSEDEMEEDDEDDGVAAAAAAAR